MSAVLGWTGRILLWLVILTAGSAVMVAVLIPRVAGATPYAITSGSMQPALRPGALIVVRPVDPATIGVGSVITFQLESGRPTVATHRVIEQGISHAGERVFRTKGDANDSADPGWVRGIQVRGTVWYSVPWLGHAHLLLPGTQRQVLGYVAATGLLVYAAYMFAGSLRDRLRKRATA